MNNEMKDKYQLSPILLYFLLFVSIIDLGILSYQKTILHFAGYNAWISVFITGIGVHVIVWMIYRILSSFKNEAMDVIDVNRICFGLIIGKIFDAMIIFYFFYGAFLMFRGYLSIVQVWLFPGMPIWPVSLVLIILIYYTVTGGIRTINGLSFWGMLAVIACVLPLLFMLTKYLHPLNLKPLLNHSVTEIMLSSKSMVFQFLGVESLLMIYPFIQSPAKSQKWAHFAVLTSTALYVLLLAITFMFYSENELKLLVWPTLHMYMILHVQFFQRLEHVAVSILCITIIANLSLSLWMASRAARRSFSIKQHRSILVFLFAFLLGAVFIKDYDNLMAFIDPYSATGFYLLFGYIPILFVMMQFKKNRNKP
ncbi:spore germination protein (amino acid permease) [Paenibacillus endophyticus]|uniref:Spore germination protein (Amino acid permease) n=1 Tax=Paenibacillus endophyticus TaxID=1294268 RepID=A0A7W5C2S0_9BACL|nr:GerAB/ArcD/ProY family transporter [Paenibacillus endophyticus]MBB3150021.1 spore germination protein (amino acid permease) [Paenibacillus endophyticus]